MTAWISLLIAIGFEIIGTSLLKLSDGFEKSYFGVLSLVAYTASFYFLAPALKSIPIGLAYAIWAGVGIGAVALIGLIFFDQRLSLIQLGFLLMILVGAVGLRITGTE